MSKVDPPSRREELALTREISAAMVALYSEVYGHDRTRASTYINGDVVVCILEDILSCSEQELVAAGGASEVVEGRVAFQTDREDELSAAVERLTKRRVVAFLSANHASPGVACELFFLAPRADRGGRPHHPHREAAGDLNNQGDVVPDGGSDPRTPEATNPGGYRAGA